MSESDELDQWLTDLEEKYPTGQLEDQLEEQFQLDLIKAKKLSKPHDSDEEEYDPQTDPYNILVAKGARGNTKRPVKKSSTKKHDNLPTFIDLDVASTSAITSIQEPTYILLVYYVNIHSKDDSVERSSNVSSDKSPEANMSLEVSRKTHKSCKSILSKDLVKYI